MADLESLSMNEKNQLVSQSGRRVSAKPVGRPAIIEYDEIWSPSEFEHEFRKVAPTKANGYVLGEPQSNIRSEFRQAPVQFYMIKR